MGQMA